MATYVYTNTFAKGESLRVHLFCIFSLRGVDLITLLAVIQTAEVV